jgi:hypothetical protein
LKSQLSPQALLKKSKRQLQELEAQKKFIDDRRRQMEEGLPHLYGMKWYEWAWKFFSSANHMNLLCAANQISKSSTQIRKCIEWAGNKNLHAKLWKEPPRQFWYMYPSSDIMLAEWKTKWEQFMPKGSYQDHPTYGWRELKEKGEFKGIEFNSGVIVYWKYYSQLAINLQSGTIAAVFSDEEMPEELYDEVQARMISTEGYFHMVFTATLNQLFWQMAMEARGEHEKFPSAFKQTISMYDCLRYMDGSPGAYTEEKIAVVKAKCKSDAEIQRRVYGRFVAETGRKYPQFSPKRHFILPHYIPPDWYRYSAVDIGSGKIKGAHPPAICFAAVRPDYRKGVIYRVWRGGDGELFTAGDIFQKYLELRGRENIIEQYYDWQAKDFKTIAARAGETFLPANKSHDDGEMIVNALFKNDMLHLFLEDHDTEMPKLGQELLSVMRDTDKKHAKDDLADALRYSLSSVPWDWSILAEKERGLLEAERPPVRPLTEKELMLQEIEERRAFMGSGSKADSEGESWDELEEEFEEWNERYG